MWEQGCSESGDSGPQEMSARKSLVGHGDKGIPEGDRVKCQSQLVSGVSSVSGSVVRSYKRRTIRVNP